MSPPENYVQKVISAYSEMGTAIRKNKPFVLHRRTTKDMFPETDVRIFNFIPTLLDEDEENLPVSYACATSFYVAQRACIQLFQLKMDGSFASYSDALLNLRRTWNFLLTKTEQESSRLTISSSSPLSKAYPTQSSSL